MSPTSYQTAPPRGVKSTLPRPAPGRQPGPAVATRCRKCAHGAHLATAEFDPLRDEGIVSALGLLQAGVKVELHSHPGTFHGSSLIATADVSRRDAADGLDPLRRGLNHR